MENPGLKFSIALENFDRDWNFRARTEIFDRDWIFSIAGPSGPPIISPSLGATRVPNTMTFSSQMWDVNTQTHTHTLTHTQICTPLPSSVSSNRSKPCPSVPWFSWKKARKTSKKQGLLSLPNTQNSWKRKGQTLKKTRHSPCKEPREKRNSHQKTKERKDREATQILGVQSSALVLLIKPGFSWAPPKSPKITWNCLKIPEKRPSRLHVIPHRPPVAQNGPENPKSVMSRSVTWRCLVAKGGLQQ